MNFTSNSLLTSENQISKNFEPNDLTKIIKIFMDQIVHAEHNKRVGNKIFRAVLKIILAKKLTLILDGQI